MTARFSMLLKSRASLTFFRACFLPGRAKDLSGTPINEFVFIRLSTTTDCWLEVSIRKVLRPATSTQFSLGFPVPKSKC